MRYAVAKHLASKLLIVSLVALFLVGTGPFAVHRAYAADLIPRSITLSDSKATATNVFHEVRFAFATSGLVGSILIEYCAETPLPALPCSTPAGFDASGAILDAQGGAEGGFSVFAPGTNGNQIVLTRAPSGVVGGPGSASVYTFRNMVNPSSEGTVYARISTFPSSDASGPSTDFGGLALAFNPPATINAEVPQFLQFCVGESITAFDCNTATEAFTDLGTLSSSFTSAAQSQLVIATNADNGYTMWAIGGTMTSGSNVIAAMSGTGGPSAAGTAQFGLNLRANTAPLIGQDVSGPGSGTPTAAYSTPNQFRYNSGDILASSVNADNYRKYTVSYIVNVPSNQPGGVYATTLTYITLANF